MRHRCGFTYSEVMVSVVIISVLLIAGVRLFGGLGRGMQSNLDTDAAETLTLEMIHEIMDKHYSEPVDAAVFGRESGEGAGSRLTYDDVDDFNGWSMSPPIDRTGDSRSRYDGLTRSVAVEYVESDDFGQTSTDDEGFKKVTVKISRGNKVILERSYILPEVPVTMADNEFLVSY